MKAAIFKTAGQPLVIETLAEPEPNPTDLIIKVKACGVCGSDLHMTEMHTPFVAPAGTVMGHEFAGEVVEVGKAMQNHWRIGDRICAMPIIGCGNCIACTNGMYLRCLGGKNIGIGVLPGAYAEYVKVGAREAIRLPDNLSYTQGALVEPLAVGLHAVNKAQLQRGHNILVIGGGPIGLAIALWARFFGACAVIVSEKSEFRRALAMQMGATGIIDPTQASLLIEEYKKQTRGKKPDVIFEAVGAPGLLQECIQIAQPDSKIVIVGVCMKPDTLIPMLAVVKELQLNFVINYRKQDFEFVVEMLAQERINPLPMVTETISLEELPESFESLRTPSHQCKIIVQPV